MCRVEKRLGRNCFKLNSSDVGCRFLALSGVWLCVCLVVCLFGCVFGSLAGWFVGWLVVC